MQSSASPSIAPQTYNGAEPRRKAQRARDHGLPTRYVRPEPVSPDALVSPGFGIIRRVSRA